MKKCQGLINHILHLKKKNNPNRSLDASTSSNMNKILKYNTKVNKFKPKATFNQKEDAKLHNSVIEVKQNTLPQNYNNQSKVKSQNNSFTTTLSSETLFLHLSNKKSPSSQYQQFSHLQYQPQPALMQQPIPMPMPKPQQSQEAKVTSISFMQSDAKVNSTYYNKMKQKMISSTVIQDKQPSNVSFYQLHKGLLTSMKKKKDPNGKGRHYLNKSMSNYDDEGCDNKEPQSNAVQPLGNRIKAIDMRLVDGLAQVLQSKKGRVVSNAKSYNLYRVALEEIAKELPKEYYAIIKKIINGYHEIVLSFVSEQKKIIENYDELKTKYSSISHELSAYKTITNIEKASDHKSAKPIEVKTTQFQKSEASLSQVNNIKARPMRQEQNLQETNNRSLYGHTTVNNTSNQNSNQVDPFKFDLFQYNIEDNSIVNNTNGNNLQINHTDVEDLEGLYFSDRVVMGNHSPINVTKNVPKLSLDFLG